MRDQMLGPDRQIKDQNGRYDFEPERQIDGIEQTPALRIRVHSCTHSQERQRDCERAEQDRVGEGKGPVRDPATATRLTAHAPWHNRLDHSEERKEAYEDDQPNERFVFHGWNLDEPMRHTMRRCDTFLSAGADNRPSAVVSKQFEQAGIGGAPVQNNNRTDTACDCVKRGFCLGDHSADDRAVLGHAADLIGGYVGDNLTVGILDARDICQQQQAVRLERACDSAGGCVAVDVECFAIAARAQRGNHGDH
mmetsp:Transcript_18433/g.29979  ORF Transcript_18433/g.29979 Transcript_18433/m.29979 type:complete len:251 (+) Transcript_18433:5235-5987(+)